MGRYATYSADVFPRYPRITTDSRAVSVLDAAYLVPAEYEIESRLSPRFVTPFSSNNQTIKDLTIDQTVIRHGMFKGDDLDSLQGSIDKRIDALISGTMMMITTSGEIITGVDKPTMMTVNADHPPVFGLGDIVEMQPSPDRLDEEDSAR